MSRKALGRGLGALIPGAPEPPEAGVDQSSPSPEGVVAVQAPGAIPSQPGSPDAFGLGERVRDLPLDRIHPNPRQPRSEFDATTLAELADTIRAQGVLQPVLVRPVGDGYQL